MNLNDDEKVTKTGLNDQIVQLETATHWREFRRVFKSSDGHMPDISLALDFAKGDHPDMVQLENKLKMGTYNGPMWSLKSRPGFIHCPGALSTNAVHLLAKQCLDVYSQPPHATNQNAHRHRDTLPQLSWSSVGFHFDWTKRMYHDSDRSVFPEELNELSKLFARIGT